MEDMQDTPQPEQDLTTRVTELEQQLAEHVAGWQRARADYQNLKRESATRLQQVMTDAKRRLLAEILPIYDHLKRAAAHEPNGASAEQWVAGVRSILSEWKQVLTRLTVEEVPTTGQGFDPACHEAVGTDPAAPAGVVAAELQGGYRVDGQLVYPAKVVVGESDKAPPPPV